MNTFDMRVIQSGDAQFTLAWQPRPGSDPLRFAVAAIGVVGGRLSLPATAGAVQAVTNPLSIKVQLG